MNATGKTPTATQGLSVFATIAKDEEAMAHIAVYLTLFVHS
jgi:hypothetical protein